MDYNYLLFGDNIWEAKSVIEKIVTSIRQNPLIDKVSDVKLKGCPAQAIYEFKYKTNNITITCLGNYSLWIDKFPEVKKYIDYFDKPDVVLFSLNKKEIVAAGEFTDTVSVGNSQWQRAQRFVAAAILRIPFLAVYAFGEDRSQGTLRESSAILTYSYLKLSCDSETPLFLIFKDSLYLNAHNQLRAKKGLGALSFPNGDEIIGSWFGLRLLNSIEKIDALQKLEFKMQRFMFDNLYYDVQNYSHKISLVDKDLPAYHSKLTQKTTNIEDIKKVPFKDFCIFDWSISGKEINRSYFKKTVYPLVKKFFKTYNRGGKFAIADKGYTKQIEEILFKNYPPNKNQNWSSPFLEYNKPTVLIPLQVWKKSHKNGGVSYGPNDPNGGESAIFPSLLDSINFNTTNIIYVFYGEYPFEWYTNFNNNGRKIYRAVNTIGKLLCVDNNGSDRKPESFKLIRRIV